MAIRAVNASKAFNGEMIKKVALQGMTDPNGNVFEIIVLDWNSLKKQGNAAKTKGFEDTFIHRTQRGLKIEYRIPGNIQWIRNQLTKNFTGELARTPHNMRMLAHMFYDKLWTIRDRTVRAEVKVEADKLDAEMATKLIFFKDKFGHEVLNPDGSVKTETLLNYNKRRRKALFVNHVPKDAFAAVGMVKGTAQLELEKADELIQEDLRIKQEEILKDAGLGLDNEDLERLKADLISGDSVKVYTKDELEGLSSKDMKTLAKAEFGITQAFSTKGATVISQILGIQKQRAEDAKESAPTADTSKPTATEIVGA